MSAWSLVCTFSPPPLPFPSAFLSLGFKGSLLISLKAAPYWPGSIAVVLSSQIQSACWRAQIRLHQSPVTSQRGELDRSPERHASETGPFALTTYIRASVIYLLSDLKWHSSRWCCCNIQRWFTSPDLTGRRCDGKKHL